MRKVGTFFLLVVASLVACASGDIGEACDEEGRVGGECVSGAVCGKDNAEALVCLKQCATQAECPGSEDCNGVSGTSIKGCRPKKR